MLKKIFFVGAILIAGLQGAMATVEREKAEMFMTEIGNKVINLLTNQSISQQERASQFQHILETKFDVRAIGKFVLGRYWKHASKEEREKFLDLFKASTVASYATRFSEYTSEKFEVEGSRPEKDGGVTVLTRIVKPNGQAISIDWKIFEKKGEMRIYDVILEGISMSITQRSEYAAVIQQGGGNVQALISALEKKTLKPRS